MSACLILIGVWLSGQIGSSLDKYHPSSDNNAVQSSAAGADADKGSSPPSGGASDSRSASPAASSSDEAQNLFGATKDVPAASTTPLTGDNSRPASSSVLNSSPASGQNSAIQTPPQSGNAVSPAAVKPSIMMRQMLTAPQGAPLAGSPMSLLEALSGAPSRIEQAQRIDAYWELCSSVADYYLALREQLELHQRRAAAAATNDQVWQPAEDRLRERVLTAKWAAEASQLRLWSCVNGNSSGQASNDRLPLPADMPHCGTYQAHYDEIFAGKFSAEAQALASLLPLRYTELRYAAAAVTREEDWLAVVAGRDKDGGGTVQALDLLALRRRAFVQIARDYNQRIARYAELAAPGEVGAEQLVRMLIKSEAASTAGRDSVPSASTGRESRNLKTNSPPPQTFADGAGWEPAGRRRRDATGRDDAVKPAAGETSEPAHRERSLLVAPRH